MPKTLTASKPNAADPAWDSRDYSLTLAGCLHLAGMPLASNAVAEVLPDEQAEQNALDAYCREELERIEADAPTYEPFHITDEKSANWYLRKMAGIETEKARILAQTEKMIADLDSDAKGLKFLYQGELKAFCREELDRKGGRKKTLHLLQGTCAFRSVPASVRLSDANAALIYARANGLPCIETTERLDAEEYKRIAAGKVLPGMETTPERETFKTTFGGKE